MQIVLLDPSSLTALLMGVKFVKQANRLARRLWEDAEFTIAHSFVEFGRSIERGGAIGFLPVEDAVKGDLPEAWNIFRRRAVFIVGEVVE